MRPSSLSPFSLPSLLSLLALLAGAEGWHVCERVPTIRPHSPYVRALAPAARLPKEERIGVGEKEGAGSQDVSRSKRSSGGAVELVVGPARIGGSYVFRPADAEPRAIIHFLGGAFVGAAPQVAYGAMLKELAAAGYVVIATPFKLRFDYLALCDQVSPAQFGANTVEPWPHDSLRLRIPSHEDRLGPQWGSSSPYSRRYAKSLGSTFR